MGLGVIKYNTRKIYIVSLISILVFNVVLYLLTAGVGFPGSIQSRKDASGFSADKARHFFYFYYYTGYFPLGTMNNDADFSKAGAVHEIEDHGEDLIMEYEHWARLGEHARITAYMPGAIVKGTAKDPSVKLFNTIMFVLGLLCLITGFYRCEVLKYGIILVVLINCTPFYIFEVYANENIFALMGSAFFIVLGLNLPVLYKSSLSQWRTLLNILLSALLIGYCSEIRNETAVVLGSLILIYALAPQVNWKRKVIYASLAIVVFVGSKSLIQEHFDRLFAQTKSVVAGNGGHVYNGAVIKGHSFWHPVYCGLGDFDSKYGYQWRDQTAYEYAVPILNSEYQMDIEYKGGYHTNNYYDQDSLYYVKFDEIPAYDKVIKAKVKSDITTDPLWYVSILMKRIVAICTSTIPFPGIGWLMLGLVFFLIRKKRYSDLFLIIISFPLSATAFIIYSGRGATFSGVFSYIVLAILISIMLDRRKSRRLKRTHEEIV